MKTVVRDQGNRTDAVSHFTALCELTKDNPPSAADAPNWQNSCASDRKQKSNWR